ncbi:MAG TPA: hypothetical protein VF614_01325, partial [Chthoniobacteraceae bacterium]
MKSILLIVACGLIPLLSRADVIVYEGSVTEVISGGGEVRKTKRPTYFVREIDSNAVALIERSPEGSPKNYTVTVKSEVRFGVIEGPQVKLGSALEVGSATDDEA